MATTKIYLDKDSNPAFYKLIEEYNSLMSRWNSCNTKIHGLRVPRIFLKATKKKLLELGKECQELQKDYADWNKRASTFALQPNYKFDPAQNQDFTYLHFTSSMRHSVNYMYSLMNLLTDGVSRCAPCGAKADGCAGANPGFLN